MDYTETSPFQRTLAAPRGQDKDAAPRKRLRDALSGLRDRATVLAGKIDRDLPGLDGPRHHPPGRPLGDGGPYRRARLPAESA